MPEVASSPFRRYPSSFGPNHSDILAGVTRDAKFQFPVNETEVEGLSKRLSTPRTFRSSCRSQSRVRMVDAPYIRSKTFQMIRTAVIPIIGAFPGSLGR